MIYAARNSSFYPLTIGPNDRYRTYPSLDRIDISNLSVLDICRPEDPYIVTARKFLLSQRFLCRVAHDLPFVKMVRVTGFEPARGFRPLAPKTSASNHWATLACVQLLNYQVSKHDSLGKGPEGSLIDYPNDYH